jgi:hypothetical protein
MLVISDDRVVRDQMRDRRVNVVQSAEASPKLEHHDIVLYDCAAEQPLEMMQQLQRYKGQLCVIPRAANDAENYDGTPNRFVHRFMGKSCHVVRVNNNRAIRLTERQVRSTIGSESKVEETATESKDAIEIQVNRQSMRALDRYITDLLRTDVVCRAPAPLRRITAANDQPTTPNALPSTMNELENDDDEGGETKSELQQLPDNPPINIVNAFMSLFGYTEQSPQSPQPRRLPRIADGQTDSGADSDEDDGTSESYESESSDPISKCPSSHPVHCGNTRGTGLRAPCVKEKDMCTWNSDMFRVNEIQGRRVGTPYTRRCTSNSDAWSDFSETCHSD